MENTHQFSEGQYSGNSQRPLPYSTAVLILGIVSIVTCICYAIPGIISSIIALILASRDQKLYNLQASAYLPGSYSNLKAGRICAIIGLVISVLFLLFIITFGAAVLTHSPELFRQLQRR